MFGSVLKARESALSDADLEDSSSIFIGQPRQEKNLEVEVYEGS